MKKILLINPRKGWRPALGLLYIASHLRVAGFQVKVLEFIDEEFFPAGNQELWKEFYDFNPDVIGLGVISWNRRVAKKIIETIRTTTRDKVIICGGKDPTFKPEIYFDYGADFVVMHEGEETTVELLHCLNEGRSITAVNGIVFRKDQDLIVTDRRPPLVLDKLNFPALDLIDYDHYCNIRLGGIPGHFIKTGFLMANRGCPYRCRFCTDPVRNIYRERSIDNIIEEIKWQMENWKIEGMVLLDDLFYFTDNRVTLFCERVLKENIRLKFYAQTRVDRVGSPKILALMKKAGFIQLALGVESGSQRMLDIMNKGTKLKQIRKAIQDIEDSGILSYIFLIVGFPEETREDLELTVKFLAELKPTFVTVNYFMPMPGTQYYNAEEEEALRELSFSLTEIQQTFRSQVSHDDIIKYRNKFLATGQRSANLNLLRYPSFHLWAGLTLLFRPNIIVKGLYLQLKSNSYTSYFDAVRTAMINYRIYGNA